MNLCYRDQTSWPVYIIIENLDAKTWQSQNRLETLLLDSISIIHDWSENANNKKKDLKTKFYNIVLKIIL